MGIVNAILVLPLTKDCELRASEDAYVELAQDENENVEQREELPEVEAPPPHTQIWIARTRLWLTSRLAQISAPTRSIMYRLWFLLAVDSLADGMVPYSLTNYYMDIKFHPSKSTLGDITSVSYFLGAIGAVFAGPLARHIGLINTMVFTHVPSSTAVLLFSFPPKLWMTAGLLLVRTGLNNMDQAPRSAFIAAVVGPEERTAVMGITSMLRTLAAMAGPTVTGLLADNNRFWIAFVIAGACRLAYDFGLYAMFINMQLYQHESKPDNMPGGGYGRRDRDEEETVELESLVDTANGSEVGDDKNMELVDDRPNGNLQVPVASGRVRSRSPASRRPDPTVPND